MKFGSVCSGIEAASVAWNPLGWEAAWFSEIEPFPSAVLKHYYPETPNLGDMTTLPERIQSGEVEAPDLFCGGTPCQAFSVAGQRKSLADARGNLSLTFCEIADVIDSVRSVRGERPCIVFWENVPGVLSTADNAFGCFLAQLCGGDEPLVAPDGWPDAGCVDGPKRTVSWRVLDAQYFGLAQRRRRVFVVASARDDFDPATVLFEFDGLRRDSAPSREAGEITPTLTKEGTGVSRPGHNEDGWYVAQPDVSERLAAGVEIGPSRGCWWDGGQVAATVTTRSWAQDMPDKANFQAVVQPVTHTRRGEGFDASEDGTGRGTPLMPVAFGVGEQPDLAHCLRSGASKADKHESTTYVAQPIAFHPTQDPIHSTEVCHSIGANENATAAVMQPVVLVGGVDNENNGHTAEEPTGPLLKGSPTGGGRPLPAIAVMQPVNFYGGNKRSDRPEGGFYVRMDEDTSKTLDAASGLNPTCSQGGTAVMQPIPLDLRNAARDPEKHDEMNRQGIGVGEPGDPAHTVTSAFVHGIATTMQVRRLTPVECERLQGFPDGYTAIPWRGKPVDECPDGPRYKALGNSWAVPVVRWIGRRIQQEVQGKVPS